MKAKFTLTGILVFTLLFNLSVNAQGVSINNDGTDPDASAILDLQSTDKGLLVPRMAQNQITDIQNPANGLIVFNTTDNKYYAYLEGENAWKEIAYGTSTMTPFVCGNPLTDPRDGQSYATVDINGQCWMAENLNVGTMSTGGQYNNGIIEKSCYQHNTSYCDTYGGLYQWNEMMEYTTTQGTQGICPDGWHVPSDMEWFLMENFLDPNVYSPSQTGWRGYDIGGQLKEAGYTHWNGPNTGATNSSGMTLLGGGWRTSSGGFTGQKYFEVFITSSEQYSGSSYAWIREFDYNRQQSYRAAFYKYNYYPVRCLKD